MMTIEQYKTKHADLIKRGVIRIFTEPYFKKEVISIDRYDAENRTFLADAKELVSARSDARNMGFENETYGFGGCGYYTRKITE
jgi:hypothetical protein